MAISIGNCPISLEHPPFLIAEMSGNHNQSLDRALAIVDAAAETGVHALKIQTYTPDTMTIKSDKPAFYIKEKESLWSGHSLYELYQKAHTPWEWHQAIFDRCKEKKVLAFSTPFDESAVDFLETLKVPAYKVASFENTDLKLLRKIAKTGKPMIISTGMATLAELDETVRIVRENGCTNLVLLKCTSSYPSSPKDSNLLTIPHLRDLFGVEVGLSDHTLGIGASIASVALGATVIERHFVLDRKEGGVDSAFSLEPHEMKQLVEEAKNAWLAKGKISYGAIDAEKKTMQFRRSLFIVKDMKAGEVFSEENLRAIRPGFGLPIKFFEVFIGKKAKKDISKGTPLSWDLV